MQGDREISGITGDDTRVVESCLPQPGGYSRLLGKELRVLLRLDCPLSSGPELSRTEQTDILDPPPLPFLPARNEEPVPSNLR